MNYNEWIKSDDILANNIPSQLKERRQWVCWLLTLRDGEYSKLPINAATGTAASVVNPDAWTDFDTAFAKAPSFDGIGYVLTEDDGLVMIDLDHCRNPDTGAVEEWASHIVKAIASYTEVSPSKRGLKILIRAKLPGARNRTAKLPWEHGTDAGIEFYETGRYTTLTGHLLEPSLNQIEKRQNELNSLYSEVFPIVPTALEATISRLDDANIIALCSTGEGRDKFLGLFAGSTSGYPSESEADEALCFAFAQHTKDPTQIDRLFRASELVRDKWDEPRGDGTYGTETIAKALEFQKVAKAAKPRLRFTRASELADQCDSNTEYILDGVLPTGGSSLLIAKPKVGKSTFVLCLSVAVARGEQFLGFQTKLVPVLYLGLGGEAKKSELLLFIQTRQVKDEAIFFYADESMPNLVRELDREIKHFPIPPLVIIDTLGKAVSVRDFNNYGEVNDKITPLTTLAQATGAHIMMVHHATKGQAIDAGDSVLGSTAIRGAVDTLIFLEIKGENRQIKSEQRYGKNITETLITYDKDRCMLSSVGGAKEFEAADIERQVTIRLRGCDEGLSMHEILDSIEGRTNTIRSTLLNMCERGKLKREGSGKKGDPFRFYPL